MTTVRSRMISSTLTACSVTMGRRSRSSTRTRRTRWASTLPSSRSVTGRHGPDLELVGQRRLHDAPDRAPGCARHRDEQRLGAGRRDGRSSDSRPPKTRSPATIPPARAGSSSRNPTGRTPEARVPRGGTGHEHAGLARAVQQRRLAVGDRGSTGARTEFGGRPDAEADAAEEGDAQQQLDRPEGAREPFGPRASPRGRRHRRRPPSPRGTRARPRRRSARARGRLRTASGGLYRPRRMLTAVRTDSEEQDDQREGRDREWGAQVRRAGARGRGTRQPRCRRGRSPAR